MPIPFIIGGLAAIAPLISAVGASSRVVGIADGRKEGYREGYATASDFYTKKLKKQAEVFLQERNRWREDRDSYEKLLDDYEAKIQELEAEQCRSDEDNRILSAMYVDLRALKQLTA